MKPPGFLRDGAAVLAVLAVLADAPVAGAAISYGTTAGGHAFAMGGIGEDENAQLRLQRARYSLWIVTASRSGEYLANAQVEVTGADGRPEYQGVLSGPWLLLELPPGTYAVKATSQGTIQRRTTTIAPGGHAQVDFLFDLARPRPGPPLWELAPGGSDPPGP